MFDTGQNFQFAEVAALKGIRCALYVEGATSGTEVSANINHLAKRIRSRVFEQSEWGFSLPSQGLALGTRTGGFALRSAKASPTQRRRAYGCDRRAMRSCRIVAGGGTGVRTSRSERIWKRIWADRKLEFMARLGDAWTATVIVPGNDLGRAASSFSTRSGVAREGYRSADPNDQSGVSRRRRRSSLPSR